MTHRTFVAKNTDKKALASRTGPKTDAPVGRFVGFCLVDMKMFAVVSLAMRKLFIWNTIPLMFLTRSLVLRLIQNFFSFLFLHACSCGSVVLFFRMHNPTTLNKQGNDKGTPPNRHRLIDVLSFASLSPCSQERSIGLRSSTTRLSRRRLRRTSLSKSSPSGRTPLLLSLLTRLASLTGPQRTITRSTPRPCGSLRHLADLVLILVGTWRPTPVDIAITSCTGKDVLPEAQPGKLMSQSVSCCVACPVPLRCAATQFPCPLGVVRMVCCTKNRNC